MSGAVYHPTATDLAAWRKLVRKARLIAGRPDAPMGDMLAAARAAKPRPVPSQEVLTRFADPLIRLALAWPAMDDAARKANADRLSWLVEGLAPLVGELDDAPPVASAANRLGLHVPSEPADDPRPERGPRRDIYE